MNKGEYKVGKNKTIFDDNLQYGKQLPDGEFEWHGETVAYKLGWTTESGRLQVQARYDQELRGLGVRLSDDTYLRWYTRRREFTEPEEIQDVVPEPAVPDVTTDPGLLQPEVAADGAVAVGTALDVSGTESREPGDPTHLIVDDQGLLVGTVAPATAPTVVQAPAATIPDWAQPAVAATPAVPVDDVATQVTDIAPPAAPVNDAAPSTIVDVPTPPTAATPF